MSEIISAESGYKSKISIFTDMIKYILISYIVSVLLLVLLSCLIVYTDLPWKTVDIAVKGITLFGAFLSAFATARSSGRKGWLWGSVTGITNIVALMAIGRGIFGGDILEMPDFVMIISGGISGITGGILGINSHKN